MKKTVVITGSSSGIGRETALFFAEKGWNVAATMRDLGKAEIFKNRSDIKVFQMDVTNPESIRTAILSIIGIFGNIHVLVNNAGYAAVGPFESASPSLIHKQFETNVFGLMLVTQTAIPFFKERKEGLIINISSVGGRITFPFYSLYHATKWAVEGFTEALNFELNEFGIYLKLVEPGAIKTDFYGRSSAMYSNPEIKDYNPYLERTLPQMIKIGERAPGPIVVARRIYEAATDGSDRIRYPVGSGAPFYLFFRRLVPDRWFMSLVKLNIERKPQVEKQKIDSTLASI